MKKDPEDQSPRNRSPYCGDPGALVSYLYNDGSADELAAIAAHVHDSHDWTCVSIAASSSGLPSL